MDKSDKKLIIKFFIIIFIVFFIAFYSSSVHPSIVGVSRIIASILLACLFCSWLMTVAFLVKQPIIFLEMIKYKNESHEPKRTTQFGSFFVLTNTYLNEDGQKLRKQLIESFIYFVISMFFGIGMTYIFRWYI